MSKPTEILPGVFIGDQFTAKNFEFFVKNNIIRVVNCTADIPLHFPWVQYMRIPVNDTSENINNEIMAKSIPKAVQFILEIVKENQVQKEKSRPNVMNTFNSLYDTTDYIRKGVLIHCAAGISRSCTIGAAVIRSCCATSIDNALAMVLAKRPIAFFNGTFVNFNKALVETFGS